MTTASTHIALTAADDAVVLRPAHLHDADSLRRLAELDGAQPLRGDVLLAERGGRLAAALELAGGRVVADPFTPTAGLITLLETRAALLRRAAVSRHRRSLSLLHRTRHAA